MSISNYSYIASLGYNCTPAYQLARAAHRFGLPKARISGPFDGFVLDIDQAVSAIEGRFRLYFDPRRVTISGTAGADFWKATDAKGIASWHHLRRGSTDKAPTAVAWFNFGTWLGRRVSAWDAALGNPNGKILIARLTDPANPDDALALARLANSLAARTAGQVLIAAVSFTLPLVLDHPNIKTFAVRPSWPSDVAPPAVNWDNDYGTGAAWKGDDASWDAVWDAV